ncbi:STAS domain-containing protein [Streptomyces sp. NPDC012769]|uniref:STAS domain-containing protein n=1 Tax=Streptomyces sp. NPDC012769 TaxID=3364848 RepID=UPI0036AEB5A2
MTNPRSPSEDGTPRTPGIPDIPDVFLSSVRRTYRTPDGCARVRHETTGSATTWLLCAAGEFDSDTVRALHQALTDAQDAGAERILLDLSRVTFGDSSFLHELLKAHYGPGRLVLVGPLTNQVRRLFELTGTLRLFHLALDRGSAGLA